MMNSLNVNTALNQVIQILESEDSNQAHQLESQIAKNIRIDPGDYLAHFKAGVIFYVNHNFEGAIKQFKLAQTTGFHDKMLMLNIGNMLKYRHNTNKRFSISFKQVNTLIDLEQFEEAQSQLELLLQKSPQDIKILQVLVNLKIKESKIDDVQSLIKTIIQLEQLDLIVLDEIAIYLLEIDQLDLALQLEEKIISLDQNNNKARYQKAIILYKQDQIQQADLVFKSVKYQPLQYLIKLNSNYMILLEDEYDESSIDILIKMKDSEDSEENIKEDEQIINLKKIKLPKIQIPTQQQNKHLFVEVKQEQSLTKQALPWYLQNSKEMKINDDPNLILPPIARIMPEQKFFCDQQQSEQLNWFQNRPQDLKIMDLKIDRLFPDVSVLEQEKSQNLILFQEHQQIFLPKCFKNQKQKNKRQAQKPKQDIKRMKNFLQQAGKIYKQGGLGEQAEIRIKLNNFQLSEVGQKQLKYFRAYFWTIFNYFQSYTLQSTGLFLIDNGQTIQTNTEKTIDKIEIGLKISSKITASLPIINTVLSAIHSAVETLFGIHKKLKHNERRDIICKIIQSKTNGLQDLEHQIQLAALDLSIKKINFIENAKPIEKGQSKSFLGQMEKIINEMLGANLPLCDSGAAQIGLQDALNCLGYFYQQELIDNDEPLSTILSDIILLKLHEDKKVEEVQEKDCCCFSSKSCEIF